MTGKRILYRRNIAQSGDALALLHSLPDSWRMSSAAGSSKPTNAAISSRSEPC